MIIEGFSILILSYNTMNHQNAFFPSLSLYSLLSTDYQKHHCCQWPSLLNITVCRHKSSFTFFFSHLICKHFCYGHHYLCFIITIKIKAVNGLPIYCHHNYHHHHLMSIYHCHPGMLLLSLWQPPLSSSSSHCPLLDCNDYC